MPKPKIDKVKLNKLLRSGKSQKEIAQIFGVTDGAITKAKQALSVQVVKSVVLENAHRVVDQNLNAVEQLHKVNHVANRLLDELTGEDKTINRMVKAVEGSLNYEGDLSKQKEHIRRIILEVNQDRLIALKACAEIRNQLKLQLEIFQALYDMKAVEEFQKEVLTAIGEVSPDVRNAIVNRLSKKRAIRSAIDFN